MQFRMSSMGHIISFFLLAMAATTSFCQSLEQQCREAGPHCMVQYPSRVSGKAISFCLDERNMKPLEQAPSFANLPIEKSVSSARVAFTKFAPDAVHWCLVGVELRRYDDRAERQSPWYLVITFSSPRRSSPTEQPDIIRIPCYINGDAGHGDYCKDAP